MEATLDICSAETNEENEQLDKPTLEYHKKLGRIGTVDDWIFELGLSKSQANEFRAHCNNKKWKRITEENVRETDFWPISDEDYLDAKTSLNQNETHFNTLKFRLLIEQFDPNFRSVAVVRDAKARILEAIMKLYDLSKINNELGKYFDPAQNSDAQ